MPHIFLSEKHAYSTLTSILNKNILLIRVKIYLDQPSIIIRECASDILELEAPSRHLDLFYKLKRYITVHHLPTQIHFDDAPPGGNTPLDNLSSSKRQSATNTPVYIPIQGSNEGVRHYHTLPDHKIFAEKTLITKPRSASKGKKLSQDTAYSEAEY